MAGLQPITDRLREIAEQLDSKLSLAMSGINEGEQEEEYSLYLELQDDVDAIRQLACDLEYEQTLNRIRRESKRFN